MLDANTDPQLNLENELEGQLRHPAHAGKLGARLGGDTSHVPILRSYLVESPPDVPVACHRSWYGFDYGMLGNDSVGDCVIAAQYHAIMHARHAVHRADTPVDGQALTHCTLSTYSAVTGYNPADPNTDQGADPVQAWQYWQHTGLPLPDKSHDLIAGFVQIDPADQANVKRAVYEFDGAGLSLALPVAWQTARIWDTSGDPNDPDWQPGSWGGHEVYAVSYDSERLAVITWGAVQLLTWQALATYGDLVLGQVSSDLIGRGGVSETGIDLAALEHDLPGL